MKKNEICRATGRAVRPVISVHKGVKVKAKTTRGSGLRGNTVRTADGGKKALKYGRKQAIYLFCVECLGFEAHPNECTDEMCPLWPFRGNTMSSRRGDKKE
jgi:hypothetical protein